MTKTAIEKEKKAKRANEEAEAKVLSMLGRETPFGSEKACVLMLGGSCSHGNAHRALVPQMQEGLERALGVRDKLLQYDRQAYVVMVTGPHCRVARAHWLLWEAHGFQLDGNLLCGALHHHAAEHVQCPADKGDRRRDGLFPGQQQVVG
jgi:hypothetical protein